MPNTSDKKPQKEDQKSDPKKDGASSAKNPQNSGAGRTIVVVDDDPTSLELISNILKSSDFSIVQAKNGKDAWLKLKPPVSPSLIICDVMMPDMDGYRFFKELKQNEEVKNIPILIVSARKNMEDSFLVLGANGFLPKPIDSKELLTRAFTLSARGASLASKADKAETKPPAEKKAAPPSSDSEV